MRAGCIVLQIWQVSAYAAEDCDVSALPDLTPDPHDPLRLTTKVILMETLQ